MIKHCFNAILFKLNFELTKVQLVDETLIWSFFLADDIEYSEYYLLIEVEP